MQKSHIAHPALLRRLRRAEGQLRSVLSMIEDGRPCAHVAQQLQAVESAIAEAKRGFIHDHIDHCLDRTSGAPTRTSREMVREFREISKYL